MKTLRITTLLSLLALVCITILAASPSGDTTVDKPLSFSEETTSVHHTTSVEGDEHPISGRWEDYSGSAGGDEYYIRVKTLDENGYPADVITLGTSKSKRKARRASKKLADALNEAGDDFIWRPECEGGGFGPTRLC